MIEELCTRDRKTQFCDEKNPCRKHKCNKVQCFCPDRFNEEAPA